MWHILTRTGLKSEKHGFLHVIILVLSFLCDHVGIYHRQPLKDSKGVEAKFKKKKENEQSIRAPIIL